MRKIKYLLILMLSISFFNSCLIDNETDVDLNDNGLNVVTFDRIKTPLTCLANGSEYTFQVPIKIVGPTVMNLKNDVSVTFTADAASTALPDVHYRIVSTTVTLTKANNYLGNLVITLITVGNTPPMEGTPEYDDYVAPVLYLDIVATGDSKVTGSGKTGEITLNFTPPNPYAGIYESELKYFHPTAGGTYPTDPYGGIRIAEKELAAVTGRKCETWFAVWDTDLCWITVNADNSITFVVDTTWPYTVVLGDPNDASKVSHFDPVTRKIYLYYHYQGTGGPRIFWEVFTPQF
jgi:hypothetical protein